MNAGNARTVDDYSPSNADHLLGVAADVLRSFGTVVAGRHVAVVGGLVPTIYVPEPPSGVEPHVGTADLDLHLSLELLEGETAEYYQSVIDGLRSLGLKQDYDAAHTRVVLWRWLGQHRGVNLVVELLAPARSRAARPEAAAPGTTAESNVGPADEIRALGLAYGHLVAPDTLLV